jgi:predicted ATPase
MGMMITRVSIQNYKSLADVTVDLGPLTVLVGANGSGKSNFVDALSFVADIFTSGLTLALMDRRGIASVFPITSDPIRPNIRVKFSIAHESISWDYSVEIKAAIDGGVSIIEDKIDSGLLSEIYSYTMTPDPLRSPQDIYLPPLSEDGKNMNSVLRDIHDNHPDWFERLLTSFSTIVPDIVGLNIESLGSNHLLGKITHRLNDDKTQQFEFSQESDGTLRVLGLLTALYQQPPPQLIIIEEPELYIHPGALFALYEVINEASLWTQIILTTHSPDLISHCKPEELRIVEKVKGETHIDLLDERQIEIINDKLFKSSDLLRIEGFQRNKAG